MASTKVLQCAIILRFLPTRVIETSSWWGLFLFKDLLNIFEIWPGRSQRRALSSQVFRIFVGPTEQAQRGSFHLMSLLLLSLFCCCCYCCCRCRCCYCCLSCHCFGWCGIMKKASIESRLSIGDGDGDDEGRDSASVLSIKPFYLLISMTTAPLGNLEVVLCRVTRLQSLSFLEKYIYINRTIE